MRRLEQRMTMASRFELFTGIENAQSVSLYRKLGYVDIKCERKGADAMVYLA